MNKTFIILAITALLIFYFSSCQNDNQDSETSILNVLERAETGWNAGDLEEYMKSYSHSDSLIFVGGANISYGWETTLKRYQKSYPNTSAMGKLSFSHIRIFFKNNNTAVVIGKWKLVREKDNPQGRFTLVFKKLTQGWKIVYDHSS